MDVSLCVSYVTSTQPMMEIVAVQYTVLFKVHCLLVLAAGTLKDRLNRKEKKVPASDYLVITIVEWLYNIIID